MTESGLQLSGSDFSYTTPSLSFFTCKMGASDDTYLRVIVRIK